MEHDDGEIFVDSLENPQSFYVIHPYGMTFLYGRSDDDAFNNHLFEYFSNNSYARKKYEWLQAFPRDWDIVMNHFIDKGIATRYNRLNFKFDKEKFYENLQNAVMSQYNVVSIPSKTLFDINGSVIPKYYWKTPEQFDKMAKAFTVIVDDKPASTAFTSFRHDDKLEIGIETMEEYRGKGLAYLACSKLIEFCIDNDLEPIWSCRYENTASVNLSKKLGFIETLRMPYYHIPK